MKENRSKMHFRGHTGLYDCSEICSVAISCPAIHVCN